MRVNRPPPGEELNFGKAVEPRPAASLILLRDGPDGAEVLLVQRNPEQRFMGGAWVFPGAAPARTTTTRPPRRCASSRRRPA